MFVVVVVVVVVAAAAFVDFQARGGKCVLFTIKYQVFV